MRGARTWDPGTGVSSKASNLSTVRPDVFPQCTAFDARSTVGMLMTHSLVAFRIPNVWLLSLITHPTSGGSKSIIVCQDIVMMFVRPL